MKKLYSIMVLLAGFLCFTACEDDRDSNPTLQEPTTFVLNTPAYAAAPYDLEKSKSIELTCSQPDYGFTAATVYAVQVSLVNDFGTKGAFSTLSSTYNTAKMNVDASEVAVAATELSTVAEENYPIQTKIYFRLKASLANGMGEIYSNSVELSNVRLHFALPPVELPKAMNIIGSFCDWNWNNSAPMVLTWANNGTLWRMLYLPADAEVKFNAAKEWNGAEFGATAELKDNATAGLSNSGGNIKVAKAGWYLIVVRTALEGRNLKYTVEFNQPNVYLCGNASGGVWGAGANNVFTVPATANGEFVSPAFIGAAEGESDGGVRACVLVDGEDWWHTEFMVINGNLEFRADGKDQTRVPGAVGQKLHINFTSGKGEIK